MYAEQQYQYRVETRLQGLKVTDLLVLYVLAFIIVWLGFACLLLLFLGWHRELWCVDESVACVGCGFRGSKQQKPRDEVMASHDFTQTPSPIDEQPVL
jgi:hypothetical protein